MDEETDIIGNIIEALLDGVSLADELPGEFNYDVEKRERVRLRQIVNALTPIVVEMSECRVCSDAEAEVARLREGIGAVVATIDDDLANRPRDGLALSTDFVGGALRALLAGEETTDG